MPADRLPRSVLPLAPLLGGLLIAPSGCSLPGGGNHRPVGQVEAPVANANAIRHVRIVNPAGRIKLRDAGNEPARIAAEVLLERQRPTTDFAPSFVEHVEVAQVGDELVIRSAHADDPDHGDWQLMLDVRLPAGVALAIEQAAGEVRIELPHTGDIDITNAAGSVVVKVARLAGHCRIEAAAGNVELRVADAGPASGCEVNCAAGDVQLQLPEKVAGEFDLRTAVGSVSVADRFGVKTERSVTSAAARGAVGDAGPNAAVFKVEAAVGNVRVR